MAEEEERQITSTQHGPTKNRSGQTNAFSFFEKVIIWVDEKNAVDIVYLNFSKAF